MVYRLGADEGIRISCFVYPEVLTHLDMLGWMSGKFFWKSGENAVGRVSAKSREFRPQARSPVSLRTQTQLIPDRCPGENIPGGHVISRAGQEGKCGVWG